MKSDKSIKALLAMFQEDLPPLVKFSEFRSHVHLLKKDFPFEELLNDAKNTPIKLK